MNKHQENYSPEILVNALSHPYTFWEYLPDICRLTPAIPFFHFRDKFYCDCENQINFSQSSDFIPTSFLAKPLTAPVSLPDSPFSGHRGNSTELFDLSIRVIPVRVPWKG